MTTATLGIAVNSNADKAAIDLDALTAASGRAEVGVGRLANAAVLSGKATSQIGFNSANLAAQLQDIAVSAQMGMGALQVGLQQGTQIAAVLNSAGGLRASGGAIAAAFASIISPVSIVTIGLTALATFGIQAFAGIFTGAERSNDALEKHSKWLDEILTGYDDARDAAAGAVDEAMRLPQASVESNLSTKRAEAIKAEAAAFAELVRQREELQSRIDTLRLGGDLFSGLTSAIQPMADMAFNVEMTTAELNDYHAALTRIVNSDVDAETRGWATDMLRYVDAARAARAETDSLGAALQALPRDVQIRLAVTGAGSSAVESMASLFMDTRSSFERARADLQSQFEIASAAARSYTDLEVAVRQYGVVLDSINEAEAKAAAERGAKATTKDFDAFGNSLRTAQERLATQQMEIEMFGQSTAALESMRVSQELTNQAKEHGIALNSVLAGSEITVAEAIAQTAEKSGAAAQEMERLQYQQSQIDALNNTLSSGFANLFIGIADGSKTAQESIGDLLSSLGKLLINQAFQNLFAPTGVGGGGFNPFGFLMGPGKATGGPVTPGMIYPVNENTGNTEYFAPAVAGTILTAEQVRGNRGGGSSSTVHVSIDARGAQMGVAEQIDQWARLKLPGLVQKSVNDPYAVG